MGCYVIAVGGTGNKILESIVYAASVDAFYALDERGKRRPIKRLNLLSVDVDAACGNTTRAKRAGEYYESVRETFTDSPLEHRGFHTALRVDKWSMNLSKRAASVNQMVKNHQQDQLLARTLFSKTEASLEYSEGFRGHPDLGVLFFADMLDSLEQRRMLGQMDELNDFIDLMQSEMDRGETVKLILCGSIFGGTGASGIPALSQYFRQRFASDAALFEMASMLMLPYYKVPASSNNEEFEIVVKSSTFLDKARTALQYYGMEGMIKDSQDDPDGIFDAIYLLGLPPESFVSTRIYSTGSQSQENDAHMIEWLATRCIAQFFRTGFRGRDAHHIDCYYYQWHTSAFCWQSFDADQDLFRVGYGSLLKAATVFFAECYPVLRRQITKANSDNHVNYIAPYFHRMKRFTASQRATLEKQLDSLYQFFSFYANWALQVIRTLPPTMRKKRGSENEAEAALANYRQLIQRYVLMQERVDTIKLSDAEQQEYDGWRTEYERMLEKQTEMIQRIGGRVWLEVLKTAQLSAREQLSKQDIDIAQLKEQLVLWRGPQRNLIDAQSLRLEGERLCAMRRARADMEKRLHKIGEDIEKAIRQDVINRFPAQLTGDQEELPQNELFNAALLDQLQMLVSEYAQTPDKRDHKRIESASIELQKNLKHLLVHRVADKVDMPRVISGLGGVNVDAKTPDQALAGFLTALLQAVMEEETL
ncbi:MAG: hypothetical protein GX096_13485 [Clostridiales bacterium]|nr:hypothetical protein [Clostridiales bacterium]